MESIVSHCVVITNCVTYKSKTMNLATSMHQRQLILNFKLSVEILVVTYM